MVGNSLLRSEDSRLVSGFGTYVGDIALDDMLHAGFARSVVAHAILRSIDTSAALEVPGVLDVYTASDLGYGLIPGMLVGGPEGKGMERPALVENRIRFAGEALAVVVATTALAAEEAAQMIDVELDEEEAVVDPRYAIDDDILLFPDLGTNVLDHDVLAPGEQWREGDIKITVETVHERVVPLTIEPLAILAIPRGDDLEVWCGHQNPHALRRQLVSLLDVEEVRVRVPDVGGAFGLKGALYPEYLVVCAAALRLKRPVRWIQQRRESFLAGNHGRGQINRLELTGDSNGRIESMRIATIADVGAYPHSGGFIPAISRLMASGPYDVRNVAVETITVVTNRTPIGPYRGAGRPEASYLVERGVDKYARRIGADPVEVRRRNLIRADQMPYRTVSGALYDGGDYHLVLDRALEFANIDFVRAEQARRLATGSDPLGLGVAFFVEQAGGSAVKLGEFARVDVAPDGTVTLRSGSTAAGQGHATAWSQLVAASLGTDASAIHVISGDTSEVELGFGSYGSRSAQFGGSAAAIASAELAQRIKVFFAERLEANHDDVIFERGTVMVQGAPETAMGLGEIAAVLESTGQKLAAEHHFVSGAQTFPYGACVVTAEVRLETGEIEVHDIAVVDDCGNRINPMLVYGQIIGAIVQGLGEALYERAVYDERGQLLNPSLVDYDIPHASDVPIIRLAQTTTPAPSNPLGVKGVGEAGTVALPPAIVGAVVDALAPYGVDSLSMPMTPQKVWSAIQDGAKDRIRSVEDH